MTHLPVLVLVLPLLAGALLLLSGRWSLPARLAVAAAALVAQLVVACVLLARTRDGTVLVYALGDWPPPYGIVLVADALAGLMVALSSVVALVAWGYAQARDPLAASPRFQALWQWQLFGLQGAFLTGDLFNLFVFFEVLLVASYALLLHGAGRTRVAVAVQVVVLNLIGSALFLYALGLIYGATGTLNLADLARVVPLVAAHDAPLLRSGIALLVVVFALKAAALPLGFWLPAAYGAATPAVAALFALLTKVGAVSLLRIGALWTGTDALAGVMPALLAVALATVVLGALGLLASRTLQQAAGWAVLYSVGTLLVAIGIASASGHAAAAYYVVHSTLAGAALFLVMDLITVHRVAGGGSLGVVDALPRAAMLGVLFLLAAIAVSGLPPFPGFVGKVLIFRAASELGLAVSVWPVLLGATLVVLVAFARIGSRVFWAAPDGTVPVAPRLHALAWTAPAALLACLVAYMAAGGAVVGLATDVGVQLAQPSRYVEAVLGRDAARESRGSLP